MTTAAALPTPVPDALPRLRRGLDLEIVGTNDGGFPSVVISDPVRGTYSKLLWPMSGLVLLWREAITAEDLCGLFVTNYGFAPDIEDIKAAATFLVANELSETDADGGWSRYAQKVTASRQSLMKSVIKNYLFFRLPLVRPDPMLKHYMPWVGFAYSRVFWWFVAAVSIVGVYLTWRQWSDLVAAAERAFEFQQLLSYVIALLVLKAFHEMGHAFTAARYGCRVPSMGIAFMVGTPVFYTDTSDSWRLGNERQRLNIVFAGVAAESIVAATALIAWPLLPDGLMRDLCFTFATASIATSLFVNLNPLMRFDGYFALSDVLKVPNLQDRSFAMGTWKLREFLFGLGEPPPESFRPDLQRTLIVYAYLTWIYRFFLFLGIAAIVYVVAGKALGIVLAVIEIGVFIAMPIWRELVVWWGFRDRLAVSRRALATGGLVAVAALFVVAPSIRGVDSPGVLVAAEEQDLHLPVAATLIRVAVTNHQLVEKGQVLFEAASIDLDYRLHQARLELELVELQLSRLMSSTKELEQAVVLDQAAVAARQKIEGLVAERRALTVRAPFAGRITDLDHALRPGVHVATSDLLARIADDMGARVRALVSDIDLARIAAGAQGYFIPDEADLAARPVTLKAIAPASNGALTEALLADRNGGAVAAVERESRLHARDGWVEVVFAADDGVAPSRALRGNVWVEAEAVSPLRLFFRQVGRVLVREQGF